MRTVCAVFLDGARIGQRRRCRHFHVLTAVGALLTPCILQAANLSLPETDYDGTFTMSWTGGNPYVQLYEKVTGGSWDQLSGTIYAPSGSDTLTRTSGTYTYRADSCTYVPPPDPPYYPYVFSCATGASKTIEVITSPPSIAPTVSLASVDYDGSYSFSWAPIDHATNYKWQQRKNSESWSSLTTTSTNTVNISVSESATYKYRVKACNPNGCSNYSNIKSIVVVTTPPGAIPTISLPPMDYGGDYLVTWNAISDATSYKWQQLISGGTWSSPTTTGLESVHISVASDGTYSYRVRACNPNGCTSYSSVKSIEVITTVPGVPTISLPQMDPDGEYVVDWSSVTDAVNYKWQEYDGDSWSSLQTTSGTSAQIAGNGVGAYRYRVKACNPNGCGSYSSQATIIVVGNTTTYQYDELGRLIWTQHPNAVVNEYEYDAADNRTSKESSLDD